MQYELWQTDDTTITVIPFDHSQKAQLIADGAILQQTFEAIDFDDAMRQAHDYMGWEPYVPMEN